MGEGASYGGGGVGLCSDHEGDVAFVVGVGGGLEGGGVSDGGGGGGGGCSGRCGRVSGRTV